MHLRSCNPSLETIPSFSRANCSPISTSPHCILSRNLRDQIPKFSNCSLISSLHFLPQFAGSNSQIFKFSNFQIAFSNFLRLHLLARFTKSSLTSLVVQYGLV